MYRLFIDDIRNPPDRSYVVARSYEAAIYYIEEYGCPKYISFDHDLGSDKSGYDIAKWIISKDLDSEIEIPHGFRFDVHSANPVGKKNIESLLNNYLQFKQI